MSLRPEVVRHAALSNPGSWSQEITESLRRSRRLGWRVVAATGALVVVEALVLAALTPLHVVAPYTLILDRQTGFVQIGRGLRLGSSGQVQDPVAPFLVQYVLAREANDPSDAATRARRLWRWTAGSAQTDLPPPVPTAPAHRDGPSAPELTGVRVKSVSRFGQTTARVRFDLQRHERTRPVGPPEAYVAIIGFRQGHAAGQGDPPLNPLGLQVTDYRRDAELIASGGERGR